MSELFAIPTTRVEHEIEIKKSRFIANVGFVADREQALLWLAEIQQRYPDARHHCWAYLLGASEATSSAAMSDDGEPSGTAGKPILNVLQHKRIGNVMVIVSRYFGGVKLGAGGLVRAYSQATEQALQTVALSQPVLQTKMNLHFDFALEQPLRHLINELNGEVEAITYTQQVTAIVVVPSVAKGQLEAFCQRHQLECKLL